MLLHSGQGETSMAEGPHAYYRQVPESELAGLIEDQFGDSLRFVLFERVDDIGLVYFSGPDPLWLHARAFGDGLELRWSKQAQGYDVNLLTEEEMSLDGWEEVALGLDDSEPTQIMLWGTHRKYLPSSHIQAGEDVPDEWIETRIPRPLKYPVKGSPPFVKICAVNYTAGDRILLTRMKSVEKGGSDG
jgi:hypothetical protein